MKEAVNRRIYLGALIATAAALALFRFFALPRLDRHDKPSLPSVLADVTDSFLGSALAALGVSALVLWLYAREEPHMVGAIAIAPERISSELSREAETAVEWLYCGHTGRYFRTAVLPILCKRAAEYGRHIRVCLELLDPRDDAAIAYFIAYRRQVNPTEAGAWTPTRARAEILATIVSLCCVPPRLHCTVYLGSRVAPTTIDMGSSLAVETRASSTEAAHLYTRGSTFFDAIQEAIFLSHHQCRQIDLCQASTRTPSSLDELRDLLPSDLVSLDPDTLQKALVILGTSIPPYGVHPRTNGRVHQ